MRTITIGKDRIPAGDIIAVEPYTPDVDRTTVTYMRTRDDDTSEKVTIDAASQDEAETIAHDRYFPKGYGVLNSKELRS